MNNLKTVGLQVKDARKKLVNVYNSNYSTVAKQKVFEDFKEIETIFLLLEQKLTLLLNSESDKIGKNDADNSDKPV